MSEPRPPRLAGRWLARVLPADVRDGILGDLEEVFRRDCRTLGSGPARRRYWRKTLSFTTRFTSERLRPGRATSIGLSWLDVKLGFRMLGRYPGLTLVGGLAIAFAIAVGASVIQFMTLLVHPTLPLDEGDRIVRIRMWDLDSRKAEERLSHDLASWRHDVRSIADLGAFRTLERNLVREDGAAFPVMVAEVSAAAFRVARVPPALGRELVDADESSSAPMVVVIGHDVWRTKFDGDPGAIGRIVRIGTVNATVVGVMPKGFAFPINHDVWLPLRLSATQYGRRQGPGMTVFGRLAPGVTFEDAQTELSSLGVRASTDFPDTHEHLRPQVLPYSDLNSILGGLSSGEYFAVISANVLFVVGLVVLMCSNVALLMFARAATRESELFVRTALGASLGRVIMQLFTEALVLAAVGTAAGLAAATGVLQSAMNIVETEMLDGRRLPFWFHDGLMPTTIVAAAGLTLLCAVIAGVGPALKVMNGLDQRLRQTTARGGGLRFGGVWTVVIVTQIALTVAFPAVSFYVWSDGARIRNVDVGFPEKEYLAATIEMNVESTLVSSGDMSPAERRARFVAMYEELERRLTEDPAVSGVTVASVLPRMYHPRTFVEVDEGGAATSDPRYPGYGVGSASVDADFFDVLSTPIIDGRGFQLSDVESRRRVAIVNQSFVRIVLGGRNPIGRHLRQLPLNESGKARPGNSEPGPWLEIVGVVRDMGIAVEPDPKVAGFYEPLVPGEAYPVNMAVHVKGDAQAFASRLRAIGATIDPTLRIDQLVRLDETSRGDVGFIEFWFRLSVVVSAVALLLSLAGIYSVMSFTVSRRTREIGIRIALGARPQRVIVAILRRPLTQVGAGIIAGGLLVTGLNQPIHNGTLSPAQIALTIGYALLMAAVCLLACVVPVRRALRVEPTEALRADG